MPKLFEKFVLHFARRHCPGATVSAKSILWNGQAESDEARVLLPGMLTDVTVEWPERKLILDCKYYREALAESGAMTQAPFAAPLPASRVSHESGSRSGLERM